MERPSTLKQLRESGYRSESVKDELRRNLIRKLRAKEPLFPGIVGYEETVTPEIQHAILARHDLLFLGLRGQGKTRMLRMLTGLLDDAIPVVAGAPIHDDPYRPLSKFARDVVAVRGDETPIAWIGRDERYLEKLATPDVTMADLIGEIDLVKHAEGRALTNEDILHFGLIPRSHRGIFCVNELPDLSPKIQVGLFNILEERDIQIRGFPLRMELDVCLVFSANPEDYTNRGRIVTPLKDRIGSVIRTHYPLTRDLGMQITAENAWHERSGPDVVVPQFLRAALEEVVRLARTSPHVNPASGVSVRMAIASYECLVSSAESRALVHEEATVVARPSDLLAIVPAARGKMELQMAEEPGQEDHLFARLIDEALKVVFDESSPPKAFKELVAQFEGGATVRLDDRLTAHEGVQRLKEVRGLWDAAERMAQQLMPTLLDGPTREGAILAAGEFILHGLHAHNRLNRTVKAGTATFAR